MKKFTLMFMFIIVSINYLFGQKETEHFIYEDISTNLICIKPKGEINSVLAKGRAMLWVEKKAKAIYLEKILKPFQELINEGIFSSERMEELKQKGEKIRIELYFDETGIVSYVSFIIKKGNDTLLTDEELYQIHQKYKTVVFDVAETPFWKSEKGTPTSFYSDESFQIPFKDLKY